MKHILYLLDGYSPHAFKKIFSNEYKKNKKKINYLDLLANNSIFFENAYGYGETYPTVYSMFNGQNIYENFCDSPKIFFSYKKNFDIGKMYKNDNFLNIYYCNKVPHYPTGNFYKRYNDSITDNFDFKCIKKKNNNYSLKKFLNENKISNLLEKNEKIFFFIHDMNFHDYPRINQGDLDLHHKAFWDVSKKVKQNLETINYNKEQDTLFFLSDHGLSPIPYNKIHTHTKIEKYEYDKYYKKLFVDEKIKFTFFIKSPKIKSNINIKKKIISQDVFSIMKTYKELDNMKIGYFLKKIKRYFKNTVIISLANAKGSVYGNFLISQMFHFHFILINLKKKLIFSYLHPKEFLIEKKYKYKNIDVNKVDKSFKTEIKNYYSYKNFIIKFTLLMFSIVLMVPEVILRKLKRIISNQWS